MTTFEQYMANEAARKETHSFSCVLLDLPDAIAREVKAWGRKNVAAADLAADGRENEPHVTVLYGIHTEKSSRVRKALAGTEPFDVKLGKMSLFDAPDMEVLKIEVTSPGLFALNEKLVGSLYNTQTHPEYKPHVTIAYLKKGKGDKYKGGKDFAGKEFAAKQLTFSAWSGQKTTIRLKPPETP